MKTIFIVLCALMFTLGCSTPPKNTAASLTVTNRAHVQEWRNVSISTQDHRSESAYCEAALVYAQKHLTGIVDVASFEFISAWAMYPVGDSLSAELKNLVEVHVNSTGYYHLAAMTPYVITNEYSKLTFLLTKEAKVLEYTYIPVAREIIRWEPNKPQEGIGEELAEPSE